MTQFTYTAQITELKWEIMGVSLQETVDQEGGPGAAGHLSSGEYVRA